MFKSYLVIVSCLLLLSCSADNLTIIIHSPGNGTVYAQGEQIEIEFTVTDNMDITSIIYFTDDLDTGRVAESQLEGIQTEYSGYLFVRAEEPASNYNITISATDEDMNNTAEETLSLIIE